MNKLSILASLLFTFLLCASAHAQTPTVTKIEPPNWWTGSTVNPVRVLVRGTNLTGARVTPQGQGLTVSNIKTNAAGTYLFADVSIDPRARPGRRTLRVETSTGAADASFEVTAPLARANRFQGFSPDDVIYLIMPDRFADGDASNNNPRESPGLLDRRRKRYYHGGDLQGVIDRLPYLKSLGVTALWLNPWYDNNNRLNEKEVYEEGPITDYHGYGAIDYYAVEERLGTLAGLRELTDKAHALGLKIIQDQVANHTGPYHPWVADSPTPTWYNGTAENHLANPFLPWTLQDPYQPGANTDAARATLDGWFINILPDNNQNDPEMRRYQIQNAIWWIGVTGLDAIRQDTLPYVPRDFWRDWTAAIKREFPQVRVYGELYDGDPALVSFFQGGARRYDGIDTGYDSVIDFPLHYAIRTAFAEGKSIRLVAQMLARDHLYPNPNLLVTFIGNHDMQRFMNEPNATYTGLRLAQTFLLTTRGVPQLYYGDEIAMQGAGDPDNRRDFPGGFPGDGRDAFTERGRTVDEQLIFEHVQKLTTLRRQLEPLRRGTLAQLHVAEQQYAYARTTTSSSVLVVINNDAKPAPVEFNVNGTRFQNNQTLTDRLAMNRFGTNAPDVQITNDRVRVEMPGRTAAIYTTR